MDELERIMTELKLKTNELNEWVKRNAELLGTEEGKILWSDIKGLLIHSGCIWFDMALVQAPDQKWIEPMKNALIESVQDLEL